MNALSYERLRVRFKPKAGRFIVPPFEWLKMDARKWVRETPADEVNSYISACVIAGETPERLEHENPF